MRRTRALLVLWSILSVSGAITAPALAGDLPAPLTSAGQESPGIIHTLGAPETPPRDVQLEVPATKVEADSDDADGEERRVAPRHLPPWEVEGAQGARARATAINGRRGAFVQGLRRQSFPAPRGGTRAPPLR